MKLRKLAIILIIFCSFLPLNSAFAAEKTIDNYIPMDIDGHWAYEEIDDFVNADIIDGFMEYDEDGYGYMNFKPGVDVKRSEFVKILVNALELTSNEPAVSFPDVKSDKWYFDFVNIASSLGIVQGKADGSFKPDANITRGEMAAMIVRAFENTVQFSDNPTSGFPDIKSDYRFANYINQAAEKGIISGFLDGEFKAENLANRAQAVKMIHKAIQLQQSDLSDEQEIIDFLTNHIQTENSLSETNSYEELNDLYMANGMGYYLVANVLSQEDIDMLLSDIAQMTLTIDDQNLNLNVLTMSNRFALVDVTGISFDMTITDGTSTFEFSSNLDGQYYLKRNIDGDWKIYNSTISMDEALQSAAANTKN